MSLKKLGWVTSVLLLSVFVGGCGVSKPSYKVVKAGVDLRIVPTWGVLKSSPWFHYNNVNDNPMLFVSSNDTEFAKKAVKTVEDIGRAQNTLKEEIVVVDTYPQTSDPAEALKNAGGMSVVAVDPKDYGITATPALLYTKPMSNGPRVITGKKEILAALVDKYTIRDAN